LGISLTAAKFLDVGAFILACKSCIVVPATVTTVIVFAQNESILRDASILRLLNTANTVEILADLPLNNLILLILLILTGMLEMFRIVIFVRAYVLMTLHIKTDW